MKYDLKNNLKCAVVFFIMILVLPLIVYAENDAKDVSIETTQNTGTSANLKNLSVDGYPFEFYENKEHYNILIDKDTNSVDVEVELEDSNSTYEVVGADDLKANDYQIKIQVTASTTSKTYTIDAHIQTNSKKQEYIKIFGYKINKDYLVYGGIAVVVIVLLVVLKVVFGKIKEKYENRKIDKAIKQIDER